MVTYERARPEDFEELVDLANYVFSHSGGRVDFPSLLPKLYKKEHDTTMHHAIAREESGIKALVGAFSIPVEVAGVSLLACGIGTVCVHPYRRGAGYMKELMRMAHEGMANADFGSLGGQRQRYRYFGYDACGQMTLFSINKTNLRHVFGTDYQPLATFRPMEADAPELPLCMKWHEERPAHSCRTKENFHDILRSWDSEPWLMEKDGVPFGYLTSSKKGDTILEFVTGQNMTDLTTAELVAAWMLQRDLGELEMSLPPFQQNEISSLSELAEHMSVQPAQNLAVFRFPSTVRAFLSLKAGYESLPDGTLVLDVAERGCFRITVTDGCVETLETDEPPHLVLSYFDAMALLFGPLGGVAQGMLEKKGTPGPAGWTKQEQILARAWFPIPLFIEKADTV